MAIESLHLAMLYLQDFTPPVAWYDVIWVQWVMAHLIDGRWYVYMCVCVYVCVCTCVEKQTALISTTRAKVQEMFSGF